MNRCKKSDLPVEWCDHCKNPKAGPAAQLRSVVAHGSIPAKYPGRCYICQEPINEGDPISAVFKGSGGVVGWACKECQEK